MSRFFLRLLTSVHSISLRMLQAIALITFVNKLLTWRKGSRSLRHRGGSNHWH